MENKELETFHETIHETFHDLVIPQTIQPLDFSSVDGSKKARNYQEIGIEFIVNSNFSCIIGDQMRLGKTPQAELALKNAYESRTPCLHIVKSANLWQWVKENKTWVDNSPTSIYPIESTKSWIPPFFRSYIISMDLFGRKGMVEKLLEIPFRLVIVDEAHSFKNIESARSKALVNFVNGINSYKTIKEVTIICPMCDFNFKHKAELEVKVKNGRLCYDSSVRTLCANCKSTIVQAFRNDLTLAERRCGVILLSGTPIKNRAEEYFIPLHLIAPEKFPSIESFRRNWLLQDSRGKWTRIKPWMLGDFKETIAPYYLRREKEDVYTDLPEISRTFTIVDMMDEKHKKAYNDILDKLEMKEAMLGPLTFANSIGELIQLRKICGMSKIEYIIDVMREELENSTDTRFAIGIHHEAVRDGIRFGLGDENCLTLSGADNADRKYWLMNHFKNSPQRVLAINMLAGGVGMDFHYCNNVIVLERMWSSADEEQFEFRFYNPDRSIMKDRSTNIEYIVAKGTIDEFFYNMIEQKRQIFGETIANNWSLEEDSATFKNLIESTMQSRMKL